MVITIRPQTNSAQKCSKKQQCSPPPSYKMAVILPVHCRTNTDRCQIKGKINMFIHTHRSKLSGVWVNVEKGFHTRVIRVQVYNRSWHELGTGVAGSAMLWFMLLLGIFWLDSPLARPKYKYMSPNLESISHKHTCFLTTRGNLQYKLSCCAMS